MADNYLRLTSLEDNNVIALTKTGNPSAVSLQYRTDLNQEWQMYTIGTELTLFRDSWIEFRNTTGTFSTGASAYYKFTSTKTFNVSGKIGSLLYYTMDVITAKLEHAVRNLFQESKVVDASNLQLNLENPGKTCYAYTFNKCVNLIYAPDLQSISVGSYCCQYMFAGCTSLIKAPALPAMTLSENCYYYMFQGCTSLAEGPTLPAQTLSSSSYEYMFDGCSNLSSVIWGSGKTYPGRAGTVNWLRNVASSGTLYYTDPDMDIASIPRTSTGVPTGWTIQYLAPKPPLVFSINGKAVSSLTINGKAVSKLNN